MSSTKRLALAAMLSGVLATATYARDLDPDMRQYVIASCSGDAFRLCPQSLGNEKDAVSCMRMKRAQLNQVCRVAYDKAARVLRQ